jgi:hypothetical protein
MIFASINSVREQGFSGFLTPPILNQSAFHPIPEQPGIYLVVRDPSRPPEFTAQSQGGHFKGRDPTVPIATLEANWVPGSAVLYIGKASVSLRRRLGRYLKFGAGHPVGHKGGRFIWQLADCDQLLFCWQPTGSLSAGKEESRLLQDFEEQYGCLPFANLRR